MGAMGAESIMLGSAKPREEYRCSKNSHLTIKHKQLPPVLPVLPRCALVNISCLCPGWVSVNGSPGWVSANGSM